MINAKTRTDRSGDLLIFVPKKRRNRGFKIRKISACIFALLITVVCALPIFATEPTEGIGLDVVAVLDASGSMKQSGEIADIGKKYLVPGVETLINITSVQDYPVNLGVVIFSTTQNTVTIDGKLFELTDGVTQSEANINDLVARVRTEYQYKSHTDQPNAVAEAIKLLDTRADSKNKKLIILLTDGVNDDGSDPNKVTSEGIDAKQPAVIAEAKEKGIMISTIGFNPNDEDFSKLALYAEETGGYAAELTNPTELGPALVEGALGKIAGSGNIDPDITHFEEKIVVPETIGENIVTAINLYLESPSVTEIAAVSPSGVDITEDSAGNRLSVTRTSTTTIIDLDVSGESGVWTVSGTKPAGSELVLSYIFGMAAPEPLAAETTPPVTAAPITTEAVNETVPETAPPVAETAAAITFPELPEIEMPKFPVEVFIYGGIGLAAIAAVIGIGFAIRAGKPPKLSGELLISYKSEGLNGKPESVEFDHAKSHQTLYEMFAPSADEIVQSTAADSAAVIKFFKKVTFEATRAGAIKFTNPYGVSTLTVNDNGYEFTAKFPVADKSDNVTVKFFVNYYRTRKEFMDL
jgi:hypothetical protein